MIVYSLIPLTALFINVFITIYIIAQKRDAALNKSYAYYTINLSLWLLSEIILRQQIPQTYYLLIFKLASVFWILIGFLFLNFTFHFIDKKKNAAYYIFFSLAIVSIIFSLETNFIVEGYKILHWGPDEEIGILLIPVIIVAVLLPIAYSLFLILIKASQSENVAVKKSAPLIIAGSLLTVFLYFFIDFFAIYIIDADKLFQYGESLTVIQTIFIFIAVLRYKLFGMGIEDLSYNIFGSMKDAIIVTDNSMCIIHFNNSAVQLFKKDFLSVKGKSISELLPGLENIPENIREERILDIDGNKIYLLISKDIITQNYANVGYMFHLKNITERKETELRLIESEKTFSELFESSPDGLIVVDKEGKIINTNTEVEYLFGYIKEEMIGKEIDLLIPHRLKPIHSTHIKNYNALNNKRIMGRGLELFGLRKDESEFPVDVMLSSINILEKDFILCTVRDVTFKKLSEQQLKESEEKYRSIIENHPHGIIETALDGTIVVVNKAYAEMYEFDVNEMIGKKAWQIHKDEKFRQGIFEFLERSKNGTLIPQTQIAQRKTKSGQTLEIQIDWDYKRNASGGAIGHITVVTDVTEKRTAERKLEKQRIMLNESEKLAHLGSWEWNIITGEIIWSDEVYKIYGVDKNTFTPSYEEFEKRLSPDVRTDVIEKNRKAIELGLPFDHIEKIVRPDGEIRTLRTRGILQKDSNNQIIGYYGSSLDITEFKNIENTLQKYSMMLSQSEKLAGIGSFEWDLMDNKVTWSDELYNLFGLDKDNYFPSFEDYTQRIHKDDKEFVLNNINNAVKTVTPFSFMQRIIKPDGEVRILDSRGTIKTDQNYKPINVYGSCLDVTASKKLENELRNSQKQLRALSASLQKSREEERTKIAREIHDEFGQILTVINMDVELMIKELNENKPFEKEVLFKNLESIQNIIHKAIKSVQNIATGLRLDVLDHLGLLSAIDWQLKEFEKRFKIETELETQLQTIILEDDKKIALFRIFQEALTNVARHAKATKVSAFLSVNNNIFEMRILDNGIGILKESLDSVSSIGLIGIRERVYILEGEFLINKVPEGGTLLHIKVPLKKED